MRTAWHALQPTVLAHQIRPFPRPTVAFHIAVNQGLKAISDNKTVPPANVGASVFFALPALRIP